MSTDKELNVAHVIAPIRFGGGESLLVSLLATKIPGVRERVICLYRSDMFAKKLRAIGIDVITLNDLDIGDGISRKQMFLDVPGHVRRLGKLSSALKRTETDLFHAHGFPASLLFVLLKPLLNLRGIYTHHFYRHPPKAFERAVFTGIFNRFARITAPTAHVGRSLSVAFPGLDRKPDVVANCVAAGFFQQAEPDAEILVHAAGRKVLIHIARFKPFKNQMGLLKGLSRLDSNQRQDMLLVFAGEGDTRAECMRFAENNGISEQCLFLGAIPPERVPAAVAAADAGLFPSFDEGFGIGAAECMARGKPVLALDTPLMQEVIGGGGILVKQEQLGEGLRQILEQAPALAEAARLRAQNYRSDVVKDQYVSLYYEIVGSPTGVNG